MNPPSYLRMDREELLRRIGAMEQVAGIRLVEAADGRARGSRLLSVWTGTGLTFDMAADRALDIVSCHYRGIPLSWISPVGYVHPAYYDPREANWLRSYPGGLFTTCGLDHFGNPVSVNGQDYVLHGRIGNLPAQELGYRAHWAETDTGESEYCIEATGTICQTQVFGENMTLRRRVSTHMGSNRIRIEDTVTNEGFVPQRHMFCYHCNIGYPLVSENSRLHLDAQETRPHDEHSASGLSTWSNQQPPTTDYQEQNFWHDPIADTNGIVHVRLENPDLGIGLCWTYEKARLPVLLQWKMMGEGTYLMGIEPCNTRGTGGNAAVPEPDIPRLAPQESRDYVLELEITDTTSSEPQS